MGGKKNLCRQTDIRYTAADGRYSISQGESNARGKKRRPDVQEMRPMTYLGQKLTPLLWASAQLIGRAQKKIKHHK
jgi:hypothetical protein